MFMLMLLRLVSHVYTMVNYTHIMVYMLKQISLSFERNCVRK